MKGLGWINLCEIAGRQTGGNPLNPVQQWYTNDTPMIPELYTNDSPITRQWYSNDTHLMQKYWKNITKDTRVIGGWQNAFGNPENLMHQWYSASLIQQGGWCAIILCIFRGLSQIDTHKIQKYQTNISFKIMKILSSAGEAAMMTRMRNDDDDDLKKDWLASSGMIG